MRRENACPLYQNQGYMYKNKVKMNETKSNYSKYDYKTYIQCPFDKMN